MTNVLLNQDGYTTQVQKAGVGAQLTLVDSPFLRDLTAGIGSSDTLNVMSIYLTHLWLDKFLPTPGKVLSQGSLTAGSIGINANELIDNIAIALDLSDYEGNLTYGIEQYANYGSLSFQDPDDYNQAVQWINYPRSILYPIKQPVTAIRLFLKQGIKGSYIVTGQSSVPPLPWNHNGNVLKGDPYGQGIF